MRILALTGGIASGKSTVAGYFRALGAFVVDADQLARDAVAVGSEGLWAVREHFGPEMLQADGTLDRAKLGERVFQNQADRLALNAILHPRIAALTQASFEAPEAKDAPLWLYDVPLLYEVGLETRYRPVVVVWVSPEVQLSRLMMRDGSSREAAEQRIASQMPIDEKRRRADFVIDNSGDPDAAKAAVSALFDELSALSQAGLALKSPYRIAVLYRIGVPYRIAAPGDLAGDAGFEA